jgi:signal transduction histidine kinase
LTELINDLLAYARVGSNERKAELVNLADLFDQIVSDLGPSLAEAGGTASRCDLPTVLADPVQMRQLLQNLVSNGIKFRADAPPRVDVTAVRVGGRRIRDSSSRQRPV